MKKFWSSFNGWQKVALTLMAVYVVISVANIYVHKLFDEEVASTLTSMVKTQEEVDQKYRTDLVSLGALSKSDDPCMALDQHEKYKALFARYTDETYQNEKLAREILNQKTLSGRRVLDLGYAKMSRMEFFGCKLMYMETDFILSFSILLREYDAKSTSQFDRKVLQGAYLRAARRDILEGWIKFEIDPGNSVSRLELFDLIRHSVIVWKFSFDELGVTPQMREKLNIKSEKEIGGQTVSRRGNPPVSSYLYAIYTFDIFCGINSKL